MASESETLRAIKEAAAGARAELDELDARTKALELDARKLATAEGATAEQLKQLKTTLTQAKIVADERKQALRDQIKALEQQKRAEEEAGEAAKKTSTVMSLALRALSGGSGEAGEKMAKAREGLQVWRDQSQSAATRTAALASSAVVAGEALLGMGSHVVQAGARLYDWVQQLEAANLRQERFAQAARAVGPAMGGIIAASQGTIESTDALSMRTAVQAAHFDASAASMVVLSGAMRRYAEEHAVTATEATNRFIAAVNEGNQGALAEFGVTAAQGASGAGRWAQAIDELSHSSAEFRNTARSEREELERNARASEHASENISALIAQWTGASLAQDAYREYASRIADADEATARSASRAEEASARERREKGERIRQADAHLAALRAEAEHVGAVARAQAELSQRIKASTTDQALWNAGIQEGVTAAQALANRVQGLGGVVSDTLQLRRERRAAYRTYAAQGGHSAEELREARNQAGVEDTSDAGRELAAARREADALGLQRIELARRGGETVVAWMGRETEATRTAVQAAREYDRALEQQRVTAFEANEERARQRELQRRDNDAANRLRGSEGLATDPGARLAARLASLDTMLAGLDSRLDDATRRLGEAEGRQARQLAQTEVDALTAEAGAVQSLRAGIQQLQRSRLDAHEERLRQLRETQAARAEESSGRTAQRRFERLLSGEGVQVDAAALGARLEAQMRDVERRYEQVSARVGSAQGNEADQRELEQLQHRIELLNQNIERTRDLAEAQREAADVGHQTARAFGEMFGLQTSSAQRFAQTATGALHEVGGAIENHILALVQGRETGAQALEAMATDIAGYVAKVGLERGAEEAVAAIASAAAYDANGAALHTAASIGYFALAGAGLGASAGLAAAHGSAQTPPGLAGPASSPASAGSAAYGGGAGNGGGVTIIYQGGRPFTTERQMQWEMRRLGDQARRALDRPRAA